MSPFFSIIIPVYQTEAFLAKCLQSVFNQTFNDYEVILVDDGSPTDTAGQILTDVTGKDARFRFFRTENQGVSEARNFAMDRAVGEFIIFIDSDDDYLEQIKKVLDSHKSSWQESIFYTPRFLFLNTNQDESQAILTPGLYTSFKKELVHFTLNTWKLIIHRSLITAKFPNFQPEEPGFYLKLGFDFLRQTKKELKFVAIENSGYYYVQHPASYQNQHLQKDPYHNEKQAKLAYNYLLQVCSIPLYYRLLIILARNRKMQYGRSDWFSLLKRKIYSIGAKLLGGWYFNKR